MGAILLIPLVATGCTSPPQATSPVAASTTSTEAGRPVWDLVVMGDSAWNGIGFLVARAIEDARDVEVSLHEWINPDLESYLTGGERSADLLQRLRADEGLRHDLREAEMILFDVPMGVLNDVCPGDPGLGTVAMVEACMPEASAAYRADVGPIFDEVVALRDPSEAAIRVTDLWQFFYPTFRDHGMYDAVRPAWQEMNGAVADAADQHGVPMVHAYDTFSGAGGDRDPVAAGDVTGDQVHLTVQGQQRLAGLVLELGFGSPSPSAAQVAGTEVLTQTRDSACSGAPLPLSGLACSTLRGATHDLVDDTDDPRTTGAGTAVVYCDLTESATADGGWAVVGTCWGTRTLANDGGSWAGAFTGTTTWSSEAPVHVHDLDAVLLGAGGYEGLQYVAHVVAGADGPWQVVGEVQPAD